MADEAGERASIPEHDLAIVPGPGALVPVGELIGALEVRLESDDPWLLVLPPRRAPDDIRMAFQAVRAACHGSADVDELRTRVQRAAGDVWRTSVVVPEDPRDWVLVQLRVPA